MISTPLCTRPILSSLLMLLLMLIAAQTLSADPYPGTSHSRGKAIWQRGWSTVWTVSCFARSAVGGVPPFVLAARLCIDRGIRAICRTAARAISSHPGRGNAGHVHGAGADQRLTQSAIVGRGPNYDILAVRSPAFGDVWGKGLLLMPRDQPARALLAHSRTVK